MTAAALARAVRTDAERIRREACATCGDRCAPFTCAWRCEVPTRVDVSEIRVGDVLVTPKSKLLAPVIDVALNTGEWGGVKIVWSAVITAEYRKGRSKPPYPSLVYHRSGRDNFTMEVLRPGVCRARCCERHSREVGDGVAYCRAHWRAWEEASF